MSAGLFSLILLAALLHAAWNFFAKRSGGGLTVLWLGAAISTVVTLPAAIAFLWGKPVPVTGLVVASGSGVVHCVYWWALARMYRHGDISLAYPIARGSGVLGTALGSMLLIHEPFSVAGGAGILLVCSGVFALGYQRRREAVRTRTVLDALLAGLTITGYSLIDDRGVERLDPTAYLAVETGVGALLLALAGWPRLRARIAGAYRRDWKTVWIIGIGSPLTYLIVLFAYRGGPVGYISAVREFSVVIAALLGMRFLGERLGSARIIGIALVVAGMVLIRIG